MFFLWWCTITPDDLHSLKLWDISGLNRQPDFDNPPSEAPLAILRLKNVSNNPGAAALVFENIMRIFMEDVLLWDPSRRASRKPGGLFGPLTAWSYCVETQARGTLHAHWLLWSAGHDNILDRLVNLRATNQTEVLHSVVLSAFIAMYFRRWKLACKLSKSNWTA